MPSISNFKRPFHSPSVPLGTRRTRRLSRRSYRAQMPLGFFTQQAPRETVNEVSVEASLRLDGLERALIATRRGDVHVPPGSVRVWSVRPELEVFLPAPVC